MALLGLLYLFSYLQRYSLQVEKHSSEGKPSALLNLHPAALFGKFHLSSQLFLWWDNKARRISVQIQVNTTIQLDGSLNLQYERCISTVNARNLCNCSTVEHGKHCRRIHFRMCSPVDLGRIDLNPFPNVLSSRFSLHRPESTIK